MRNPLTLLIKTPCRFIWRGILKSPCLRSLALIIRTKCWLVKLVAEWMFKAYIVWSICADAFLVGGIIYLIFFNDVDYSQWFLY